MINSKIDLLIKIIEDYRIITYYINYSVKEHKPFIEASKILHNTIKSLCKEIGEYVTIKKTIKETIKEEYNNSPNVIYIKSEKGFYRTYNKINYLNRHIIYASTGYGVDVKYFTYNQLKKKIRNKEIELK